MAAHSRATMRDIGSDAMLIASERRHERASKTG